MELHDATEQHRQALTRVGQTRAELHAAILAAMATGMAQAEIARITGYTRETLRRLALKGQTK